MLKSCVIKSKYGETSQPYVCHLNAVVGSFNTYASIMFLAMLVASNIVKVLLHLQINDSLDCQNVHILKGKSCIYQISDRWNLIQIIAHYLQTSIQEKVKTNGLIPQLSIISWVFAIYANLSFLTDSVFFMGDL